MGLFGLFGKKVTLQCTCGCGCSESFEKFGRRAMDTYTMLAMQQRTKWRGDYTICMDCNMDQHTKATEISGNIKNRQKFSSEVEQITLKKQGSRCNNPDCRKQVGVVKGRMVFFEYDHIDGNPSNNEPSNCQVLCKNCHQLKTERERNSRGTTSNGKI